MSPEWEAKNERRIFLIESKPREEMTKEEIEELDRIQHEVFDELDTVYSLTYPAASSDVTEVI